MTNAINLGLAAPVLANPNLLYNGAFQVWQRGTSFAAAGYGPDMWYGGNVDEISRQNDYDFTHIYNSYVCRFGSDSTSHGNIENRLPAVLCRRTPVGYFTVSGWARSISGGNSFQIVIRQPLAQDDWSSGSNLYVETLWAAGEMPTDWTFFSYTFALTATQIRYGLCVRFNNEGLETHRREIAFIKLEVGRVATPFVFNGDEAELIKCEAFYQTIGNASYMYKPLGNTQVSEAYFYGHQFRTPMYMSPTLTIASVSESGSGFNGIVVGDIGQAYVTEDGFRWNVAATQADTGASSVGLVFIADGSLY